MTTPEFDLHLPFPTCGDSPIELKPPGPARLRVTVDAPYTLRPIDGTVRRASLDGSALWLSILVPVGEGTNSYPLQIVGPDDKPVGATTVRVTLKGKGDEMFPTEDWLEVKARRSASTAAPMMMDGE